MNPNKQNDPRNDDLPHDAALEARLQSASLPAAPGNFGNKVQQRIGRRVFQQRAMLVASLLLLTLTLGLLVLPRTEIAAPIVAAQNTLDDELLASLFAPPPVDSLAVLDRRQQFAVQALQQLEKSRP